MYRGGGIHAGVGSQSMREGYRVGRETLVRAEERELERWNSILRIARHNLIHR
jgi:hypothetical protein